LLLSEESSSSCGNASSIGEVEATIYADGFESKSIGPWTTKSGEDVDAGTVSLRRKP